MITFRHRNFSMPEVGERLPEWLVKPQLNKCSLSYNSYALWLLPCPCNRNLWQYRSSCNDLQVIMPMCHFVLLRQVQPDGWLHAGQPVPLLRPEEPRASDTGWVHQRNGHVSLRQLGVEDQALLPGIVHQSACTFHNTSTCPLKFCFHYSVSQYVKWEIVLCIVQLCSQR